jgi:hypothetical protein
MASPGVNAGVAGACEKFLGRYCSEPMEKMRRDWVVQTDPGKRKKLAEEVPYALCGAFVTPGVFRKNVRGMLPFAAPLLWKFSLPTDSN